MATLVDQLILHEGLQLKPYSDTTGHLTIGVGRNLSDVGISEDEARFLLAHDLQWCERRLRQYWPWTDQLDSIRRRVLLDMLFNLGLAKFTQFQKFLTLCEVQSFGRAAEEMLESLWAHQVGRRAERLSGMMRTGQDYDSREAMTAVSTAFPMRMKGR